ncbi:hypothetical protein EDC18_107176 [Natranaerovirga pectinivora]|uniref:DUF881 domain-containing protein n=1 Tax=Natranaerovirga pectinivora TaxID=682400 RepID=A0A4R3MIV2_9FIRM|nr:hypothetical protein [Natranaerovirga pectinivora]TCT14107.1 hypothetical protein EDC18_107176 [Natranaerovirga pectinivora]
MLSLKKAKIFLALSVFCLMGAGFLLMTTANKASTPEPGSVQDPLVTKSYIDKELAKLEEQITKIVNNSSGSGSTTIEVEKILSEYNVRLQQLENQIHTKPSNGSDSHKNTNSFIVVELNEKDVLIGGEGTELIVRAGKTFVLDNLHNNGIPNMTTGKTLFLGDAIDNNHLLVIPRDDGRGIVSSTKTWVMVKGEYSIIK